MKAILEPIDALLHGGPWAGEPGRSARSGAFLGAILLFGCVYGACMGLYGWKWGERYGALHVLSVMAKVPVLFLATLVVTAPSLYVFSTLGGSTLALRATLRLLFATTALALAVLASLAPVTAFFTFSTKSHPFMQLLNAAVFTVAGLAALRFLLQSFAGLATKHGGGRPGFVLRAWAVVYGLVAAQMGWILRPFIGSPHLDPALVRPTESNVFFGLLEALRYLGDG
jgi:hypothetical protein